MISFSRGQRLCRGLELRSNSRVLNLRKQSSSSHPPQDRVSRGSLPDKDTLKQARVNPQILRPYLHPDLSQEDYFGVAKLVTIEDMFNARVHFGHKIGTCNENMKWALYGERLGVCIFDLEITQKYLVRALNFLAHMSYSEGMFLFVTTNRFVMAMVEDMSAKMGHYSHVRKWDDGVFTNSRKLFSAPIRLPDALIFLNVMTSSLNRHPAIVEAAKMAIPTIGVVDSNSEPNYISYVIPGNDDSAVTIQYYMDLFEKAIELGRKAKQDERRSRTSTYKMNNHQQMRAPVRRTQFGWRP